MKSLLCRVLAGVLLFVLLGPCLTVRAEEEGTKIMGEAEADAEDSSLWETILHYGGLLLDAIF